MAKGWANPQPFNSRGRFHYFDNSTRSLCGKWALLFAKEEDFEDSKDEHKDNCKECQRKKLKATETTP